jgi:hypothetical protein
MLNVRRPALGSFTPLSYTLAQRNSEDEAYPRNLRERSQQRAARRRSPPAFLLLPAAGRVAMKRADTVQSAGKSTRLTKTILPLSFFTML